jgi:hypothetical protein
MLSNNIIYVVDLKVTEGGPPRGGSRKEADSWVNAFDASTRKLLAITGTNKIFFRELFLRSIFISAKYFV